MRYLSLLVIILVLSLTSCRNDFEFEPSTGGLEFSKDTVYLDTVFTNIGSSTYRLKVFNRSDNDISIPQIRLGKGTASKYRIMVDGMTGEDGDNDGVGDGKIFNNVELLANDSLFVFIEVTADVASANPSDFLYTDKIEFTNISGAPQDVDLVTLIQDAIFIYPQRTGTEPENYLYESINLGLDDANEEIISVGSNLSHTDPVNGDEFHWTAAKPYVIYGYALVPGTETLVVDAGARVHFHANSGLIVGKDAKIQINGGEPNIPGDYDDLSNEVIFEGDRLEPLYTDVPGQWGTLMILSNSTENTINHLTIKNATVGILMQNIATGTGTTVPNLTITNSQIYNCSNVGILARKSNLTGSNLVGNYCGQATLACTYGGTYNFTHCTFNNDWNSSRQVAVLISDYFETEDTRYVSNLNAANFTNCIIYGSNQIEMLLDKTEDSGVDFNYLFKNCLIRFNNVNNSFTNNPLYDFDDPTYYSDIFLATNSQINNPRFVDTNINDMRLSEDLNLATETAASNFNDILNLPRATSPDLGAYQFVP